MDKVTESWSKADKEIFRSPLPGEGELLPLLDPGPCRPGHTYDSSLAWFKESYYTDQSLSVILK